MEELNEEDLKGIEGGACSGVTKTTYETHHVNGNSFTFNNIFGYHYRVAEIRFYGRNTILNGWQFPYGSIGTTTKTFKASTLRGDTVPCCKVSVTRWSRGNIEGRKQEAPNVVITRLDPNLSTIILEVMTKNGVVRSTLLFK